MTQFSPRPFVERAVRCAGVRELAGFRLKAYEISHDGSPIDRAWYEPGMALGGAMLPRPATSRTRPGVGFVIAHEGAAMSYLVLAWWDSNNELVTRVLTSPAKGRSAAPAWSGASPSNSFCVWDLQVMWFERNAYVETVLQEPPDLEAYMGRTLGVEPGP